MKKIKRIFLGLFLLIILLAIAIRIMIPRVCPKIASDTLSEQLETPVQVNGMNLGLIQGKVGLDHFIIEQPASFTNAPPLLTVSNPQIQLSLTKLLRSHVDIKNIQVDAATLHIIRNADGILNLQQLVPASSEEKPEKEKSEKSSRLLATLAQLQLSDITITYTDYTTTPPTQLAISNLQVAAQNLVYSSTPPADAFEMPGKVQLSGNIQQPGYPDGYLGLVSSLGVIQTNIPAANAALRVVGFDLRALKGLIPSGIAAPLGGSNLDIIVDTSVSKNYLAIATKVQTAKNTLRLDVGGTPLKPILDKKAALFNLITRPTAFLTGTVSGVTDAGVAAGQSVVATAERAGGGILSGLKNIGKGAATTLKGVAQGDVRGIGDGVRDITIGTVTGAVNTVTSTAMEVGAGLGNTVSAAAGRTRAKEWEGDNAARWKAAWREAQEFVASAPYPGTQKREKQKEIPAK